MSKQEMVLSHSELSDALEEPLAMIGGMKNAVRMLLSMFPIPADARPHIDAALSHYERRERIAITIEAGPFGSSRSFSLTIVPDGSSAALPQTSSEPFNSEPFNQLARATLDKVHAATPKPHGKPKKRAMKKGKR